jgi:hypothetical protein
LKIKKVFIDYPNKNKNYGVNFIVDSCIKNKIDIYGVHHGVWVQVLKIKNKFDSFSKNQLVNQQTISANLKKVLVYNNDFKNIMNNILKKNFFFIGFGSIRFTQFWKKILFSIYQIKKKKIFEQKKLKILYLDHSSRYNLEGEQIYLSIKAILVLKNIDLIIKPNTSSSYRDEYDLSTNKLLEFKENFSIANTVDLVNWSDIVISSISSAGIEALLQNRILVCPQFFHNNLLSFVKYNVCYAPKDLNQLIRFISSDRAKLKFFLIRKKKNIRYFIRKIVHANYQTEKEMFQGQRLILKKLIINE